ncbi:MAG: rod shape-determining protein RodA [bacterium]
MRALWIREVDWVLVGVTLLLAAYGVIVLVSATHGSPEAPVFLRARVLHLVLGAVALVAAAAYDYRKLGGRWPILYAAALVLLASVFVAGEARLGAQRWISLGPLGSLQPSELAKLAIIVTLARHLDQAKSFSRLRSLFPFIAHVGVPMLLIVKQPDLGTAMVLVAVWAAMLYVAGGRARDLAAVGAGGAAMMPLLWGFLHDYQRRRLMAFLDPSADPLGAGYALIQSKIAVGSGQLFGKGLFAGTQNLLRFIPEQHTDFIFTVVGEELGLLGGTVLLALYALWLWRALVIAAEARDRLGGLIATGVATMVAFHVIINVGMTIGLLPITGIPLPFLSYGGSALLATLAGTGLLLSIGLRRRMGR